MGTTKSVIHLVNNLIVHEKQFPCIRSSWIGLDNLFPLSL